jgi:putative serine protease PepD
LRGCQRLLREVTASLGTVGGMSGDRILPPFPPDSSSEPSATYGSPYGTPSSYDPPPPSPSPGRGRAGFAAAVLAGALVVGAGAGVGGAAAWDAWQGDPASTTGSTERTTSQVVDTGDTPAAAGSVEDVASTVLPSVVKIDVATAQGEGSGSGIILSSDGQILTNNHVVEGAVGGGRITVSFSDGSHADATVLGTDPLTDTAVIRAEGVDGLTPATMGASGNVDVGQEVVAIGSPFGLDATVTSGIVSALDRPVNVGTDSEGNATVYPAIQTDAAINPGNSGGPLVDMQGHVIGINSSIRSSGSSYTQAGSIGLGFAIPIDEVMAIVDDLAAGEPATHARLGIGVEDAATTQTAVQITDGAIVGEVTEGSAAADAGLRTGDVITRVDEQEITSADSLIATVRSYRPGDEVTVTYQRDGEEQTATVTLESDAETG